MLRSVLHNASLGFEKRKKNRRKSRKADNSPETVRRGLPVSDRILTVPGRSRGNANDSSTDVNRDVLQGGTGPSEADTDYV